MAYRTHHLAVFSLAAVLLTAGLLLGIRYIAEPILADARALALHEFFFNRSCIQWITLIAFCFTLSVLAHRIIYHRSMLAGLRHLAEGRPLSGSSVAQSVVERFERVRHCKEENGPIAAAHCSRELAQQDEMELERIYGLLGHAVQLMMALGFLGTVWGVSQAMSGSFGSLLGASTELMKSILGNFTNGLSTALDTTVLGLITSLVATVTMTTVRWSETNALQALGARVCAALSVDTAIHNRDAEPLYLLRAELSAIAEALLHTTGRALTDLVSRSVQVFESNMSDAVQEQLVRIQGHERRVSETLVEAIRQQMVSTLQALEEQRAQASTGITTELRHIAEQLRWAPEVSIRYPSMNGTEHDILEKE